MLTTVPIGGRVFEPLRMG